MRGLGFRYVVGVICVALLGSGTLSGCGPSSEPPAEKMGPRSPEMGLRWLHSPENPKDECPSKQVINVELRDPDLQYEGSFNLVLKLKINNLGDPVEHSSTFVKTSETTGYFDLTVGETLPKQSVRSGSNELIAFVSEDWDRDTDGGVPLSDRSLVGSIYVSDCDEEQVMSSSAAPESAAETAAAEPDTETSAEPDNDVEQPVSDLKAEFHFGKTSGCPFMQAVDVAGVADTADVSLKLSIDGEPVKHTAEFITEGEYVKEASTDISIVAGDDFKTELEGEHLKVEVSDGVGSVTKEGKFTPDSS